MMNIKTSNEAAQEICKILGVGHRHVRGVTIILDSGSIAIARVEFVITQEQWAQIGRVADEETQP